MFLDGPDWLFTLDGVPTALVRAGEPPFRRPRQPAAVVAERVDARPRASFLDRLLRPAAS